MKKPAFEMPKPQAKYLSNTSSETFVLMQFFY